LFPRVNLYMFQTQYLQRMVFHLGPHHTPRCLPPYGVGVAVALLDLDKNTTVVSIPGNVLLAEITVGFAVTTLLGLGGVVAALAEEDLTFSASTPPAKLLGEELRRSSEGRIDKLLDERHGLRAVLVDILLMRVRVVAVAAVGIGGVAVGLDDGRVGGGALEAGGAGGEALVLARPDVVGKSIDVMRIAHEDSSLDGLERSTGESRASAAAEGVVEDLTALGVADHDDCSVGTLLVEGCDGLDHGLGSLRGGAIVAGTATAALAAASRIDDGLLGCAGVGFHDLVDESLRGAVALGHGGLAGAEDVHLGAGLALLDGGSGGNAC